MPTVRKILDRARQLYRCEHRPRGRAAWLRTVLREVTTSWVWLTVAGMGFTAEPGAERPSEYQVKAADLFIFSKFTTWPADRFAQTNSPVVFGVVGEDPFQEHFKAIVQTKFLNGRPLTLTYPRTREEMKSCHVLFISRSERGRVGELLGAVRGLSVLTVSEIEQFTRKGGMIEYYLEAGSVKFEINTVAAADAGLELGSQLLKAARITKPSNPAGPR